MPTEERPQEGFLLRATPSRRTSPEPQLVFVGSYTAELSGHGTGISSFTYLEDGRLEPAGEFDLPCPSWLEWHPSRPVLYCTHELEDGAVSALRVRSDGSLTRIATESSGGALPCHLAVTADGRHLFAANYGSGSTAVFALDPDGRIAARTDLIPHEASGLPPGPVRDRQDGSHAHMVVVREDLVTVVDLGLDALLSYRLGIDGRLNPHSISQLRAGTGPRQLVRPPGTGKAIVLGELAGTLTVVAETEPGTFTEIGTVPASAHPGPNQTAHLLVSPDGSWAMASNRGPDTIALFSLSGDLPRLVEEYPVGPGWPRHFGIVGDHLYVGNQHADRLLTFTLDITSGRLTRQGAVATGTPACVISRPTTELDEASRPG